MPIDPRAVSTWDRAAAAYDHYVRYLDKKKHRFALSFTDLVYVKNFKGGRAVVAEPFESLQPKLSQYTRVLQGMDACRFFSQSLGQLVDADYYELKEKIVKFAGMGNDPATKVSGFGVSFTSTLLHFHFPKVAPILDRRAVNGAKIRGAVRNKQGDIVNLLQLYPALIDHCRNVLRENPRLTLRELDRILFIEKIRESEKDRKRK